MRIEEGVDGVAMDTMGIRRGQEERRQGQQAQLSPHKKISNSTRIPSGHRDPDGDFSGGNNYSDKKSKFATRATLSSAGPAVTGAPSSVAETVGGDLGTRGRAGEQKTESDRAKDKRWRRGVKNAPSREGGPRNRSSSTAQTQRRVICRQLIKKKRRRRSIVVWESEVAPRQSKQGNRSRGSMAVWPRLCAAGKGAEGVADSEGAAELNGTSNGPCWEGLRFSGVFLRPEQPESLISDPSRA
uniref:Uncharacterized protein n=1 Tax=Steinernema glaseri TaxID=37863 RepID=A0A1I7Z9N6_9BILA